MESAATAFIPRACSPPARSPGWIFYGQFLYSLPETNVNYNQLNYGSFVVLSSLLFYTGEQALAFAETKEPHTTGSFGFELRPLKRVRVIESLMTDRLHTAAAGLLTDMILSPSSVAQTTPLPLSSLLVMNYNQEQIEVLVDVTRKLMLRGGYRYVWGDAETPAALIAGAGLESSQLRQNVALAGVTFRLTQKLSANLDFEGASTSHAYFRTSLYNYQKMRARARYQVAAKLALQASFSLLDNQNPSPGINYDFLSRQNSLSATWTPGKRVSVLGGVHALDTAFQHQLSGARVPHPGAFALPGRRPFSQRPGGRGAARLLWIGAAAGLRRVAVHFFGQPPHQLLPAAGAPVRTAA